METPLKALDKITTEAASGIRGLRLWIKGRHIELFPHELRKLAVHFMDKADEIDPPKNEARTASDDANPDPIPPSSGVKPE